ncbi:MAG: transketolase family protein [Nitrosotalea sp.]
MRGDFFNKLKEAMQKDEKIFFLMGDTGFNLVEPIFEQFPERTLNVGVAEQNLIGIASGLSNMGFKPVCYAISNFLVHRCFEQIRNDLCIHNYPVVLVGTSTGFDNGALWATHYVVDDIGSLKALPNIKIYSPSSVESINSIFDEVMRSSNPSYIRITKSNFVEGKNIDEPNRFILRNDQSDILVVSHGKMIKNSVEAEKLFPKFSIFAMDRIKPVDEQKLERLFKKYKAIIVIEDNFRSGLYSTISQFAAEKRIHDIDLYSISPIEDFGTRVGDSTYLEDKHGLSPKHIASFVSKLTRQKKSGKIRTKLKLKFKSKKISGNEDGEFY